MKILRRFLGLGVAVLAVSWTLWSPARAALEEEVRVPVGLQVTLLSKVARYDQNLAARAGGTLRVAIAHAHDDGSSRTLASQAQRTLSQLVLLPGVAQGVELVQMDTPAQLVAYCEREHISLLLLSSGFQRAEVAALAQALAGKDLLSASLVAADAAAGAVVAFDADGGKPAILVNLAQAQRQNVRLAAALLALARVVP